MNKSLNLKIIFCFVLIIFLIPSASSEQLLPWTDINQNGFVEKYEAQQYTIHLKDSMILARGIRVWENVPNKANLFFTEQPNGQELFIVWNNRIRLLSIITPSEFVYETETPLKTELILERFQKINWPEFTNWQLENEENDIHHIVFAQSQTTLNNNTYNIKLKIGILKQIGKICSLETTLYHINSNS